MALNINGTTGISGVDASVAAPALKGSDSNTGISFGSDSIKFSTGGVERMAITNSGVSGITAAITMADSWIISTNFTTGAGESFITSNWSRFSAGNSSAGVIGGAMTESSGVFTFPVTGMYLITTSFSGANGGDYFGVKTRGSTDNFSSSDFDLALSYNSTSNSSQYFEVTAQSIFDVTNVSTHKVKFRYEAQTSTAVNGSAAKMRSGVTFIRLGDT